MQVHDLCTVPSTGDALLFLTNAGRYLPEDEELDEIKRKVVLERKQYFLTCRKYRTMI